MLINIIINRYDKVGVYFDGYMFCIVMIMKLMKWKM